MPNKKAAKGKQSEKNSNNKPIVWAVLAATLGIAILAVVGKVYVTEHSESIRFVTVNALSLLVFIAIVFQAYIYHGQRDVMERQLKATEKAVESSYIAQRAYIGVTGLKIMCSSFLPAVQAPIIVGEKPTLYVTWHNGGATPAEHFRAVPYLSFGEKPEYKGYMIDDDYGDMQFNFIPAGKVIEDAAYPQAEVGFPAFTKQMVEELNSGKKRLYAVINAIYIDFTGQTRELHAEAIYDPWHGRFSDLYEYRTSNE